MRDPKTKHYIKMKSLSELCLFVPLLLCFSSWVTLSHANASEGRKLFGGYKITPRFCKPTRKIEIQNPGPNICMFNHECATRQGIVVGACMDGFLFGACCQLPATTAGELLISDLNQVSNTNNYLGPQTKTTFGPTIGPTFGPTVDVMSNGVSHITESFLDNSAITTAQDNEIVQINGRPEDFGYSPGIIYSSTPETYLHSQNNDIDPLDFKLPSYTQTTDRSSTHRVEDATAAYGGTLSPGLIQIAISHSPYLTTGASFQKPMFRPRPTSGRPEIDDKYVLVPTIFHPSRPNKTQELESILNIVQLINDTSTPVPFLSSARPSTIYLQYTDNNKPLPTVSFATATTKYPSKTSSKRPSSTPLIVTSTITKRPTTPKHKTTSKKPPSTSYVFSTTIPPRRTTQPIRKPPTSTTKRPATVKKPTYVYPPSTLRPGSSYATSTSKPTTSKYVSPTSRPGTVTSTKRPPSTSYVTGPTPPRRPATVSSHVAGPSYTVVEPTKNSYTANYGNQPPPPVIVFAPITAEDPTSHVTSTPKPKPVTQLTINNIVTANNNYHFSTSERPPPTVLITPKPPASIITAGSYRPVVTVTTDYTTAAEIEIESSGNDFNNFPPVRNPNLNISGLIGSVEDDTEFTTPTFIDDQILDQKVESFVNKIVQSLQEPFNELKDVVYNTNKTSFTSTSIITRKPTATTKKPSTTKKPLRLSSARPGSSSQKPTTKATTKRPTTRRTTTSRTTTPVVVTTTTKKTKPTRRITTTPPPPAPSEEDYDDEAASEEELDYRRHCGIRPLIKSGRIVGGKGSTFGEWPWQVLVRESTWLGLFTKNKCGGVLISKNFVVTAAHCQPGFLASLVAVFGEYDISGDLETKRPMSKNVKRVIVHRQYDAATFENDLALLELESSVDFDQHIVPICLPRGDEDFTSRFATVTGWGRLKYGGGVPSVLQEVKVPIMENHVCQEMFRTAGHNKNILDSFLCAGYANGQKDSCEGDSGGPLVLQRPDGRWQLAGTVSHGIKCAAPYLPGVYMRTTYYKPWLESITGVH